MYGLFQSDEIWNFSTLLLVGTFLTFIFVALSINLGLLNINKIKGFGYAILIWLLFAVIYDGLFLILLIYFNDYPLEKFALIASVLNPIDLSRILILLKLDISALMGYTGALFESFFGTTLGLILSFFMLFMWTVVPTYFIVRKSMRKDF